MNDWLTVREAAALAKVSRKTIYQAVAAKQLRAARFASGREIRTSSTWIAEWLNRVAQGPVGGELRKSA